MLANGLYNSKIFWNVACMKNAVQRNYYFKVYCISDTLISGNDIRNPSLANSSEEQYVITMKGKYRGPCYLLISLAM